MTSLPPASILIVGALLAPLFRGRLRSAWLLALTVASGLQLAALFDLPHGSYLSFQLFDLTLVLLRIDKMSLAFGLIFHVAALFSVIYSLHVSDGVQQVSGLLYAGAGIGAVFAGDLVTLFVYWELTAVTSVFLVWAGRTERSYRAGMRYLIIQVGSGVLLLAGILLYFNATGSIAFDHLGAGTLGTNLILLAFGVKCAFPLLHTWVPDAYPESTVTGTVFLSVFTTKLAVYALARGFAGTELLIWIGVTMTLFPLAYIVIENDLRRVVSYSLINQLGYMVTGIGLGTAMALNGTVAHAMSHIVYKALLFMAMGAVLHRTGEIRASELGGLVRSMPWTAALCSIGAFSIVAFPGFNGFVSKSLITTAAAEENRMWVLLGLLFAASSILSGLKVAWFAFFGRDSGVRCKEAPWNMLLAMGITAAICVAVGVFPGALYSLLPNPVDYEPYTVGHVVTQLQLLLWALLAFAVLMRTGLYPAEIRSTLLDVDWFYRRALPAVIRPFAGAGERVKTGLARGVAERLDWIGTRIYRNYGPEGVFARTWATSGAVLWVVVLLGVILVLYYV